MKLLIIVIIVTITASHSINDVNDKIGKLDVSAYKNNFLENDLEQVMEDAKTGSLINPETINPAIVDTKIPENENISKIEHPINNMESTKIIRETIIIKPQDVVKAVRLGEDNPKLESDRMDVVNYQELTNSEAIPYDENNKYDSDLLIENGEFPFSNGEFPLSNGEMPRIENSDLKFVTKDQQHAHSENQDQASLRYRPIISKIRDELPISNMATMNEYPYLPQQENIMHIKQQQMVYPFINAIMHPNLNTNSNFHHQTYPDNMEEYYQDSINMHSEDYDTNMPIYTPPTNFRMSNNKHYMPKINTIGNELNEIPSNFQQNEYNTPIYEDEASSHFGNSDYIDGQYNVDLNNDYMYNDDYPIEDQENFDTTYKRNADMSKGVIHNVHEYMRNMMSPIKYNGNKLTSNEHQSPDTMSLPQNPTKHPSVGRIVIYEIHRPYFNHLQNTYRNIDTDQNFPEAIDRIDTNNYLPEKVAFQDHKKATKDNEKINKHNKPEKRNAGDKKYTSKHSILTQRPFPITDQLKTIVRRHDATHLPFRHIGPFFNSQGYGGYPNSINSYGLNGRAGYSYGYPQNHDGHYGDINNRELTHILFRVFGI